MLNFFSALSFLTIIPTPRQATWSDNAKTRHFPLVGLLIGALLYGVDHFLSTFAYREIRAALDVIFLAVITGGLHLDGLADSADGLFSHTDKHRALEIMKDPRIGSMGAITAVLCLLLKFSGLLGIDSDKCWIWLLIAPALARSTQVIGLVFMDDARGGSGMGAPLFQNHNYGLLTFCAIPVILPFFLGLKTGLLIVGLFAVATITPLLYFQSRIGGMTGDTFGAVTEIVETTLLVAGGLACMHSASL